MTHTCRLRIDLAVGMMVINKAGKSTKVTPLSLECFNWVMGWCGSWLDFTRMV